MKKLKGCRPLIEINNEYSHMCGVLGDTEYKLHRLEENRAKILDRLVELDLEAAHAKAQGEEETAEPVATTEDAPPQSSEEATSGEETTTAEAV